MQNAHLPSSETEHHFPWSQIGHGLVALTRSQISPADAAINS